MRLFVLGLVVACSSASPRAATRDDAPIAGMDATADPRRWYAGDLHMHVAPPDTHADVMMSAAEIATAAAKAGMDFVVLTPHLWPWKWQNQREPWRAQWRELAATAMAITHPTLIPGVEWTTGDGHFTIAGADLAALDDKDFLAAADAAGAWISVNHPFATPTKIPGVRASHYDMSYRVWTDRREGFAAIDGAEVWNVPLGFANLVSRPGGKTGEQLAWAELDRVVHSERRRVTAVGGTDNHQLNVMATTWVLAVDATASAILAALRDGATCIGGPEAGTLRARGDADWVAIGGDITGPLTTLEWRGTARVFVDNVDQGEHADRFTHATEGALHTYRIELGTSRSGFIYANL
ncbi:MAG TPA: hypothetical protein VIV11_10385 [Kofleriaceae bacterium]